MSTLAVNDIRAIVSCDMKNTVYENVNLYCRDGLIEYIGPEKRDADKVIDGKGMLCYPGLVIGSQKGCAVSYYQILTLVGKQLGEQAW